MQDNEHNCNKALKIQIKKDPKQVKLFAFKEKKTSKEKKKLIKEKQLKEKSSRFSRYRIHRPWGRLWLPGHRQWWWIEYHSTTCRIKVEVIFYLKNKCLSLLFCVAFWSLPINENIVPVVHARNNSITQYKISFKSPFPNTMARWFKWWWWRKSLVDSLSSESKQANINYWTSEE